MLSFASWKQSMSPHDYWPNFLRQSFHILISGRQATLNWALCFALWATIDYIAEKLPESLLLEQHFHLRMQCQMMMMPQRPMMVIAGASGKPISAASRLFKEFQPLAWHFTFNDFMNFMTNITIYATECFPAALFSTLRQLFLIYNNRWYWKLGNLFID